jgi:hypothetical protein
MVGILPACWQGCGGWIFQAGHTKNVRIESLNSLGRSHQVSMPRKSGCVLDYSQPALSKSVFLDSVDPTPLMPR